VVPSGSLSPATASPPAGVLQVAASSESDEHASVVPSPSTQQPRTSGDGVFDPEQVMSLSASGSTGHDVTERAGRQGQDPQDRNPMPPASGTYSPSPSLRFSSSTSSSSLQHQAQGVDPDWLAPPSPAARAIGSATYLQMQRAPVAEQGLNFLFTPLRPLNLPSATLGSAQRCGGPRSPSDSKRRDGGSRSRSRSPQRNGEPRLSHRSPQQNDRSYHRPHGPRSRSSSPEPYEPPPPRLSSTAHAQS
jgi:hypothetical protein